MIHQILILIVLLSFPSHLLKKLRAIAIVLNDEIEIFISATGEVDQD